MDPPSVLRAFKFLFFLSLSQVILATGGANPCLAQDMYFGQDHPNSSTGYEVNFSPLARIGRSANVLAPQGDYFFQLSTHLWYKHMLELRAVAGYGISYSTVKVGAGAKLNLLEVFGTRSARVILKDIPGFGNTGLHQRGVLGNILGDFMLYGSVTAMHYNLAQPNTAAGQTYDPSVWAIEPGLGVQLYTKLPTTYGRGWYLDIGVSYVPLHGSHFISPTIGFGFELR